MSRGLLGHTHTWRTACHIELREIGTGYSSNAKFYFYRDLVVFFFKQMFIHLLYALMTVFRDFKYVCAHTYLSPIKCYFSREWAYQDPHTTLLELLHPPLNVDILQGDFHCPLYILSTSSLIVHLLMIPESTPPAHSSFLSCMSTYLWTFGYV